jgi:two-component SAPR family response regulator
MVLDDDFDIATLVKMALQRNGFKNVFVFTDPLSALKNFRIKHMTYSLVISDIIVPIMNGFEFVMQLSRIKPEIKILFMTAFNANVNDLLAMNLKYGKNVGGIIQKPVSPKKQAKIVTATTPHI